MSVLLEAAPIQANALPTARALPNGRLPIIGLLAYCGFLFCYGINSGPFCGTEGLRALVAAEMLRSGDWLVPRLYGEPLLTKPPVHYAAIALVSWPCGEVREWTARLPSALAAMLLVFIVYRLFARALNERAGVMAALILPLSLMWLERVPSAEIDMVQVAWVAGSLSCLYRAVAAAERGESFTRQQLWWLAALLCVAGGVLTKWTAPAFFYLTALPFLWRRGRLRLLLSWPHLLAALLAALVCSLWIRAVVSRVGWELFVETLRQEALPKLLPGQRDRPSPWYDIPLHPLLIGAANLPWSLMALWTLRPSFARLWSMDARRLLQLLHCWTWPNLLFWTLVPNHAFRHCLPLVPGLIGLGSFLVLAWLDGRLRWPVRFAAPHRCLVMLVLLWLGVKVGFVHYWVPKRLHGQQPAVAGRLLAEAVPEGEILYLRRVKDESVMFYYGRPVRRLSEPLLLPDARELVYCMVTENDWQDAAAVVRRVTDSQGKTLLLIRLPR